MSKTVVILTRHGETVWNTQHRIQGILDSSLTKQGSLQGQALAKRMKSIPFDHLYSSDLGRCRQTAQYIADQTGHKVKVDESLRERNFGVIQGLERTLVRKKYPDVAKAMRNYDPDFQIPDGESYRHFLQRVSTGLEDLATRHPGKRIMVVSHGGALMVLFKHWLGIPISTPRKFFVKNASYNVATFIPKSWMIETMGDVSHLHNLEALDEVIQ